MGNLVTHREVFLGLFSSLKQLNFAKQFFVAIPKGEKEKPRHPLQETLCTLSILTTHKLTTKKSERLPALLF